MDPIPFEIREGSDTHGNRVVVAANGSQVLMLHDPGGRIFRRRGLKGLALKPACEVLIPLLNQLTTDMLQHLDMPAQEAVGRLLAIAGMVSTAKPQPIEWAVAELDGVRVYANGSAEVIVTKMDMTP